MNKKTIAIVGGTGTLGNPVVHSFLENGWEVRVVGRDPQQARKMFPGVDCVLGNVETGEGLLQAFAGCTGVHLNLGTTQGIKAMNALEVQGSRLAAEAAMASKIPRLTMVSGLTAGYPDAAFKTSMVKHAAERAVKEVGIDTVIFRPTWFFESLPRMVRKGAGSIIGSQPHPLRWVAASDFATMVRKAHENRDIPAGTYDVVGPEALTMHQALSAYLASRHPGAPIRNLPVPIAQFFAMLSFSPSFKATVDLFGGFERLGEHANPKATEKWLGAPQTRLSEWLQAA